MLPPLRSLIAFKEVSRLGSISATAKEMNVTQAAVSQQLKNLEDFLGCDLFIRNQRGIELTKIALQYLPVVKGSLEHLKLQTQQLFAQPKNDVLRIKINHSIAHSWLLPRLQDFIARFPFIKLDISLLDWPSQTPCSEADIEITNGYTKNKDTSAELIAPEKWSLVCSPTFKKIHRDAFASGNISQLPAIQVKGYEENWMQWFSYHQINSPFPNIQLEISNSLHAIEAVKQDIGLLLVRSLVAQKYLKNGEIVLATEKTMPAKSAHYIITHHKRSPKVNFFCDWLHEQILSD